MAWVGGLSTQAHKYLPTDSQYKAQGSISAYILMVSPTWFLEHGEAQADFREIVQIKLTVRQVS